jgi:hypothetical protein
MAVAADQAAAGPDPSDPDGGPRAEVARGPRARPPVPDVPEVARPGAASPATGENGSVWAPAGPAGASADPASAPEAWVIASTGPGPDAPDGPAPAPADDAPAPAPATAAAANGGIRGDGTQTLVFRRPAPIPTRAVLRVIARDGTERTVEVDGTPLSLGRAADNGLVIADPRISRHHARLQARRGTLVFTDLGSTNGSRVNGVRVDECALGTGDRVLVGDTVLLVEQLPG